MPNELMSREERRSTETRIAHLSFDQIDQNPFRDLINNPLTTEQVEGLAQSIRSTTYWQNSIVRPHPKAPGRYQLAYGHARLEAARLAGLTDASFMVMDLDDQAMLRMMANENVTQLGKDRFATYKEATVAAANYIMSAVLADPELAPNFGHQKSQRKDLVGLVKDIAHGGCPGRDLIALFYTAKGPDGAPLPDAKSTLDKHSITDALKVYHDTGELAAWHKAHNPAASRDVEPTLDPEALRRFTKTDHVRTFVKAVQDTNTPVAAQREVADRVISELAPAPARSRTGRENFQDKEATDRRFNSQNIRAKVVVAAAERTRSAAHKARLERMERMTSLERALVDFDTGLTRALNGYRRIQSIIKVIGPVTDADMTVTAREHATQAAKSLAELQSYLTRPAFKKLLRIKGKASQ